MEMDQMDERQKLRVKPVEKKSKFKLFLNGVLRWLVSQLTFQKLLVIFLVYKGVTWVDQSYALAWAGNIEIASDLSQKALVEILGVALLYSVKALFENMSKNNSWPDKPSDKNEESEDENSPVG